MQSNQNLYPEYFQGLQQENSCPNCGYCPHCGRSNRIMFQINPYQPLWYTITRGQTSISGIDDAVSK